MTESVDYRSRSHRQAIETLAIVFLLASGVALAQEPPAADARPIPPAVERAVATIARIDGAVQELNVEALGRLLAPEFTESTRGCGPDKPRNSRQEYLATLAGVARTNPTSYRRERGQLSVSLLGDGEIVVVRSQVTDRVEWSTGSLTATSQEALYLGRVGDDYKATSLDAQLACTDMQLVGSMPEPPGG